MNGTLIMTTITRALAQRTPPNDIMDQRLVIGFAMLAAIIATQMLATWIA